MAELRQPIPFRVRTKVRQRAGHKCERCGKPAKHSNLDVHDGLGLDFHHVNGKHGGKHDVPTNLRLLCKPCHRIEDRVTCPACGFQTSPGGLVVHTEKHRWDDIRAFLGTLAGKPVTYQAGQWGLPREGVFVEVHKRKSLCVVESEGKRLAVEICHVLRLNLRRYPELKQWTRP